MLRLVRLAVTGLVRRDPLDQRLDLSNSYRTVFDTMLDGQVADQFHVVGFANTALNECRRRVQNDTVGHRSRKNDRFTAPPPPRLNPRLRDVLCQRRRARATRPGIPSSAEQPIAGPGSQNASTATTRNKRQAAAASSDISRQDRLKPSSDSSRLQP